MQDFTLNYNEETALQAEPAGNYIKESGFYPGTIVKALLCQGTNGSKAWGVEFYFKDSEGAEANYLQLWCANRNGGQTWHDKKSGKDRPLLGLSLIQSIMGLCGIAKLEAKQGKEAKGFPAFTNKPIAFALQKELYTKTSDGSDGYKFNIVRAFNQQTFQTLSESLNKKEATIYKNKIEDKDSRDNVPQTGSYASQQTAQPVQDNDLPF